MDETIQDQAVATPIEMPHDAAWLFDLIQRSPGCTITDITAASGLHHRRISRAISFLRQEGLIDAEPRGRFIHLFHKNQVRAFVRRQVLALLDRRRRFIHMLLSKRKKTLQSDLARFLEERLGWSKRQTRRNVDCLAGANLVDRQRHSRWIILRHLVPDDEVLDLLSQAADRDETSAYQENAREWSHR